jgi:predicted kinase
MSEEEKKIADQARKYIRKNRKAVLFRAFADDADYVADTAPVTVFMAGSPGAGKTEISRELVKQFKTKAVHIDADEIRKMLPGYTGTNAHLFQAAASIGVDELYIRCLSRGFNVVVDGTFAHLQTDQNIRKSFAKDRKVVIYFIYQDPVVAWDFTRKREVVEQRKITKDMFVKGYCLSRSNVAEAKAKFGDRIELNLIIKNLTNDAIGNFYQNISSLDMYIPNMYTESELYAKLP